MSAFGKDGDEPPAPSALRQLMVEAQFHFLKRDFSASLTRLDAASRLAARLPQPASRLYYGALIELGISADLGGLKRYQEALSHADAALAAASDPQIAASGPLLKSTVDHVRGAILYRLGRRDEALAAFQRALSEGDKDAGPWLRAIAGATARPRSATLEYGTDRPGLDIRNIALPAGTPEMCRDTCLADPSCRAFTLVQPGIQGPDARCWLKHAVPPPNSCAWCVSGVVQ